MCKLVRAEPEAPKKKKTRPTGFEPVTYGLEVRKPGGVKTVGVKTYNLDGGSPAGNVPGFDPELAKIVKAWPGLSLELKRIICKMVE